MYAVAARASRKCAVSGRVRVARARAVALALEQAERDERVGEVGDGARMEPEARAELGAGERARRRARRRAELDRGEQHLRAHEAAAHLEDAGGRVAGRPWLWLLESQSHAPRVKPGGDYSSQRPRPTSCQIEVPDASRAGAAPRYLEVMGPTSTMRTGGHAPRSSRPPRSACPADGEDRHAAPRRDRGGRNAAIAGARRTGTRSASAHAEPVGEPPACRRIKRDEGEHSSVAVRREGLDAGMTVRECMGREREGERQRRVEGLGVQGEEGRRTGTHATITTGW